MAKVDDYINKMKHHASILPESPQLQYGRSYGDLVKINAQGHVEFRSEYGFGSLTIERDDVMRIVKFLQYYYE